MLWSQSLCVTTKFHRMDNEYRRVSSACSPNILHAVYRMIQIARVGALRDKTITGPIHDYRAQEIHA